MLQTIVCTAAAVATTVIMATATDTGVHLSPEQWPAHPNTSCHSPQPSGHIVQLKNVTHDQCAEACAAKNCSCYDTNAAGDCDGTALFWGLHSSHDRTAYTNQTTPAPPPPVPPPAPPAPRGPWTLHPTLGDHMVLQRAPVRAAIYGWAITPACVYMDTSSPAKNADTFSQSLSAKNRETKREFVKRRKVYALLDAAYLFFPFFYTTLSPMLIH